MGDDGRLGGDVGGRKRTDDGGGREIIYKGKRKRKRKRAKIRERRGEEGRGKRERAMEREMGNV
jgi:hypothetical protein